MNDPLLVGRLQRLRNLLGDRQRLVDRDRPLGDPISEGRSFDEFQHQCLGAVLLFEAMDARDAGVIEAGEHLRLPLEPRQAVGVAGKRLGQDLERDLAVELGVGGLVDLL